MHLFFGLRARESDFLFAEELAGWQREGRLARLTTATSRGPRPYYVQDALRHEAAEVLTMIRSGARIMVCGGRAMDGCTNSLHTVDTSMLKWGNPECAGTQSPPQCPFCR